MRTGIDSVDNGQREAALASVTPRPTATPRVTPSPIPDNVYVLVTTAPNNQYATLRRGMHGTPVQQMQQAPAMRR